MASEGKWEEGKAKEGKCDNWIDNTSKGLNNATNPTFDIFNTCVRWDGGGKKRGLILELIISYGNSVGAYRQN